ncbi:MAG: phytanoyl-CoA dioxygenase family protein [Planctomycetota bacterium]
MSKISRWTKRVSQSTRELVNDVMTVMSGLREYKKAGKTPEEAYFSMRRLYRTTNGRFNDVMATVCKAVHRKQRVDLSTSLFEDATDTEIANVGRQLRKDGFYRFERQLPKHFCDALLEFSLSTPGVGISLDPSAKEPERFNRQLPQSPRHQFRPDQLFADETVQQLATDPYFFSIAQAYLGFNPVQDLLSMWWSAPGDSALQSRAAQLYHFDMDRFKFVKFFVYLTDVDANNGPHCYVRGSHVRKPATLLRDERISDEEILQHYPSQDLVELTGPVGTMLAVDTRGFHKGKPLVERDRLIFQIQFADSLFGQNYPPIQVDESVNPTARQRLERNRRCYANFELNAADVDA